MRKNPDVVIRVGRVVCAPIKGYVDSSEITVTILNSSATLPINLKHEILGKKQKQK
jgi:hypothetical protein